MTKIIRFACNVLPFLAFTGKVSAENNDPGLFDPFPDWRIEYQSLMHPPLGETPVIWLAAQSVLVELLGAFEPLDYGLWPDINPIGKLPGEKAGEYLAALLVPEDEVKSFIRHPKNSSLVSPALVCTEIIESSITKMEKVPQTSDVLEFGASYIFGNGFVVGFSKSVCKALNPEMVKKMKKKMKKKKKKKKARIDEKKLNTALNAGFNKLTNALLTGLGTDAVDTVQFVSQLEARLRYVDHSQNLERTFGRLLSDLTSQTTQFASIAAHQPNATKSLREFNKLSCNALSRLPHRDARINLAQWHETENATAMVGMFAEISIKSLEFATPIGGKIKEAAQSAIISMSKVLREFGTVPYSYLNGRSLKDSEPRVQLRKRKHNVAVTMHESSSSLPPVSSTSSYFGAQMASHPSTSMESATFKTTIANSRNSQPSFTATMSPQDKEAQPTRSLDTQEVAPTPTVPTTFAKRPPFLLNFWHPHPFLDKHPTRTVIATQSPLGEVMPTPLNPAQLAPGIRRPGLSIARSISTVTALPTIARTIPRLELVMTRVTTTVKKIEWQTKTETEYHYVSRRDQ
ncbi:hypothetical protein COCC4DRAFT_123471 [Bipolaris maydis ATCC 48331]|uniref:Uncharacterized protein n=2 Tax=Cochliobolus heterostrophus TaxID=5016 RepID=M2V7G5_COCH5|nr:uncharacterized protein COCC4DRAFT_123471 [Bipolaris maydis ATCC 48331]EMD95688.1 hypothetical protein COCHEDRAFT_1089631 [Bipolaris maydis C5]KAJ5065432.1 hypothetical protein J3E74DRAFT_401647 [Bipolaris maydis]ENI10548.1 hypothetical protein COCC4DRAFT_123471 [Bipolaris maydis ATCC 48331]KAJ6213513.1 hypothetical protein PSV09DRAFT_1089631 [Bipolaris maydis]KAJ6274736.1 hypothetical protein PSV08DRAFT_243795 [Bipolaris maydis]